jgi:putative acetyltransferase
MTDARVGVEKPQAWRCRGGLRFASVLIRREHHADEDASRAVQVDAFAKDDAEPVEARLLDDLRSCPGWIPSLSWVAECDKQIVGHCVSTRGFVDDVACVGLGPIGVTPARQRSGIGSSLVYATIGAADAAGEPLIALLGDPDYYGRFGFEASSAFGIHPPEASWGNLFQVRPLTAWQDSITGTFRYAEPFTTVR